MPGVGRALPAVTMSEAQAYVRIETGEEEAVLAGLIRSASALCEAFINQVVIVRPFSVELPASIDWQRLHLTPVQSIDSVETVDSNGVATLLSATGYAVDIDSTGDGWIRLNQVPANLFYALAVDPSADGWVGLPPANLKVRVSGTAGMAQDENGVPEPIRQGILRLVAHLFTSRDGEGGNPPAAVTALWRPYRRMRLS